MANTLKVGITAEDKGFKSSLDAMKSSANSFGDSLDATGKKTKSLNGALREAKKEAMNLALAYEQLDATARSSDFGKRIKTQLDQALQAAGQLQDIKSDVSENIKNIASDTAMWDAAKQGIGVVSTGLQGLASAYGLVGGDVKAFAQALVAVNAIQSVANSIIGIGNALQKQSALMVGLRAAKEKLFGAAKVASTAAETANTGAVVANTTAVAASEKALEGATVAQVANNTAVLANPYVLAAAAVVALTAAIVAWYVATDDATESEKRLAAEQEGLIESTESLRDAIKKGNEGYMKTRMEMDRLIKTVNNFTGTKKEEERLVKELNSKYGESLGKYKSLNDWKNALATTTLYYCRVMQAEAKYAALSAAAYDAYAKALAGEDYTKNMAKFNKLQEHAESALDDVMFYQKQLKIARSNAGAILDDSSKGSSKSSAKKTTDEVKRTLETLEGCDAIIQDADKDMKKLKATSANYTSEMERLMNIIITAKSAKINFYDKSTTDGLNNIRSIIIDILKYVKVGSSEWVKYQNELSNTNDELLNLYDNMYKAGDVSVLSKEKSLIEEIINSLSLEDQKLIKMSVKWREINNLINEQNRIVDNLKNGVEKGSITWLEQDLQSAQKRLDEWLKNHSAKLALTLDEEAEKNELIDAVNLAKSLLGNARVMMKSHIEEPDNLNELEGWGVTSFRPIDITFNYKKTPLEQIEHHIDYIKDKINILKDVKLENVGEEEFKKAQSQLKDFTSQLNELNKQRTFIELTDDIKQYNAELRDSSVETMKGFVGGLQTLYNVVTDLPERLDECRDGFEGFFEVMNAGFSIFDSIMSFIENIKQMIEVINLLTGAKEALNIVEGVSAGTKTEESMATQQQVTAIGEKAIADSAEVAAAEAKTGALKLETTALLDAAAAQIFAAHSSIPFAGVGIATGFINEMLATMTAAKTATMAMAAFAEGGIVKGSTTIGDNVLARVNSGEMILNGAQQSRLFNMIDHGQIYNEGGPQVSTVRIKGSDIVLSLKNYSKINHNSKLTNVLS